MKRESWGDKEGENTVYFNRNSQPNCAPPHASLAGVGITIYLPHPF